MKIVSFLEGTLVVHCTWDEIRPATGAPHGAVLELLREKYNFQGWAASPLAQQINLTTPMLDAGQFQHRHPISHLEFQPNQVLITCATTSTAEEAFYEIFQTLQIAFGFRPPSPQVKKNYRSTIIAEFAFDVAHTLGKWNEIADLVNSLKALHGPPLSPSGIRFLSHDDGALEAATQFVFEHRVLGNTFERTIFSHAPLTTAQHEAILRHIEELFT